MESMDTFVIALMVAIAAAGIYRKYIKKNQPGQEGKKTKQPGFGLGSDDDYEPYSGN
jgi:hypothetical protein